MRIQATAIFALLTLFSCQKNPKSAPDPRFNFTIEPGKRIGLITPEKCSPKDVLLAYGDSATVENIYLVEGMEGKGIVLFGKSPRRRVEVFYDKEIDAETPAFIRIRGVGAFDGGSDWAMENGIKIGSPIAEVQKINGVAFDVSGFGWDYGGRVTNWNGGKFDNQTGLQIALMSDDAPLPEISGEVILKSDNPVLAKFSPVVDAFELNFRLPDAKPELVGTWHSTTDPKSSIKIGDGMFAELYEGKVLNENPYRYQKVCPEDCGGPAGADFPCIRVFGQDVVCFAVVKADGKTLEISQVGGRGNTLKYWKN